MTVTDQIKILDRRIMQNEAQYDLDRKAAKISALSSKNLDKYEYLTGEDLGLKPSTVEQTKFEYSPLGKVLTNNTKSKTNKNKVDNQNKQNKNLIYNSQHSFVKFKDIGEFKELSLDSMHKKLKDFHKKFIKFKNVIPQTEANKNLKEKVLDNVGDLFNELYYIYKDKYNEEINSLDTKDRKNFNYTKLRLTDDYQYKSEEEQEQTIKKSNKKEPPKKPTKVM